jgi:hypothetical protein
MGKPRLRCTISAGGDTRTLMWTKKCVNDRAVIWIA